MEEIMISCPYCGTVVRVRITGGREQVEGVNVRCRICRHINPLSAYRRLDDEDVATRYPTRRLTTIGHLVDIATGRQYSLQQGRNIVGRQTAQGTAQVQIPCPSRRMSREHVVLTVAGDAQSGITHTLALCKEQVNDTFVNGAKLEFGDEIILNNGDILHLPDGALRFVVPDADNTEIYNKQ